jgi:serine/threonine-protein kinase
VNKRYPTADQLLYDLEHYIYHTGYGPTNETLGKYIRELFGQNTSASAASNIKGSTELLESAARIRAKT